MSVKLNSTGGGSVTLQEPTTASDFTLTLPAATGTVLQSGTAVTVAQGGTGTTTLTANNVLLGNGTSAVQTVAPGTNGNVLTSNGTTWLSSAPAGGGQIQSQVFTANGTWTAPTGVTRVRAFVIGGGGGNFGSGCGSNTGGLGGYAVGDYTVVPGTGYSITVGAGGAGVTSGTGAAGGTSSFASFASATGGGGGSSGGGGSAGVGSSGTLRNANVGASQALIIQGDQRSSTNSPLVYSSTNNAYIGAGGTTNAAARAGVTGVVYLEWVGA